MAYAGWRCRRRHSVRSGRWFQRLADCLSAHWRSSSLMSCSFCEYNEVSVRFRSHYTLKSMVIYPISLLLPRRVCYSSMRLVGLIQWHCPCEQTTCERVVHLHKGYWRYTIQLQHRRETKREADYKTMSAYDCCKTVESTRIARIGSCWVWKFFTYSRIWSDRVTGDTVSEAILAAEIRFSTFYFSLFVLYSLICLCPHVTCHINDRSV